MLLQYLKTIRGGDAYVHIDGLHERVRAGSEPDSDARREDLGQAVEAQDSSYLGLLELEVEVRGYARGISVVQKVVWVICSIVYRFGQTLSVTF